MKELKYEVALEGRAWSGPEGLERFYELPGLPVLDGGKLYLTDAERLSMLAALLEQCGAVAAVKIGALEVWREAVQAVDVDRRQHLAAASGPVMGRDILESMPFNDDPTLGEIAMKPLPNHKLDSTD